MFNPRWYQSQSAKTVTHSWQSASYNIFFRGIRATTNPLFISGNFFAEMKVEAWTSLAPAFLTAPLRSVPRLLCNEYIFV